MQAFPGEVLFVQGKIEEQQKRDLINTEKGQIELVNFMQSKELETALNSSELVLSRSGYTTVMDLAKLGKKAFFIPTPGQYEQIYLAERLQAQNWVPFCRQEEFRLAELERVSTFKGLTERNTQVDYDSIFSVFSRVKENSEPTSSSLST